MIALFNKRGREGFTERDHALAAAFASHAAMAVERATAYRAMEQSRNYLQMLMDRTYSVIFVLDPADGRVRDVNAAGLDLLGRPREEVLGRLIVDLVAPADQGPWRTLLTGAAEAAPGLEREHSILSADGTVIPLDLTATCIDVDDAPVLVCLGRDRRPRLRHEQAERLSALGEMASGVAHDFNNLLGMILGRAELMLMRLPNQDAATRADLEVIKQAVLDGAETVKRLQKFSGVARMAPTEVADVGKALHDAVEFTRPRWRDATQQRGVTIDVVVEAGETAPAAGGAAELREVLVNMIFNAVDAMPHGGRITLRSWQEGDTVLISVADTGVGMTEAVRARVFDPFFTTKGARGSGLGLSASYGIISNMGGRISVQSEPYQGATFLIEAPAGERPAPKALSGAAPGRSLSLLLVDDEPQILRTTKLILEIEGHHVTATSGGRAALDAVERERFDAVLTDLGMPEMNGVQLAEAIRARGGTMPILLTTGWGLELDVDEMRAAGITDILPKPFDIARLRAKLAELTHEAAMCLAS
ncbi:MAG: response regulator [Dehalococcoidia bacterium]